MLTLGFEPIAFYQKMLTLGFEPTTFSQKSRGLKSQSEHFLAKIELLA